MYTSTFGANEETKFWENSKTNQAMKESRMCVDQRVAKEKITSLLNTWWYSANLDKYMLVYTEKWLGGRAHFGNSRHFE